MRWGTGALVTILAVVCVASASGRGAPKPGAACTRAGAHAGYRHGTLVCRRKGKKLVWTAVKPTGKQKGAAGGGPGEQGGGSGGSGPSSSGPGSSGPPGSALGDGHALAGPNCKGTGSQPLTHMPMDPGDFLYLLPYGLMTTNHVLPVDHQYFGVDPSSPRDAYPVYAAADATIVNIQHRTEAPQGSTGAGAGNGAGTKDEYRIVFSVSCTFFYYYDLVTSLAPQLKTAFDAAQRDNSAQLDYPVKSGDQIGRIGGQTMDFAVWDTTKTLSGFVVPAHYYDSNEVWKVHTVDPLDYASADVKAAMLAKDLRSVEPRSGKLDWDADGKLRGNWFLKGTDGNNGEPANPNGYWVSFLSFSPDYLDPSRFWISMGDYDGKPIQYTALGNTPDPATVGPDSGLVKYQLTDGSAYVTPAGAHWDGLGLVPGLRLVGGTNVVGTVLVQMTDGRTLEFEAFPGKTAGQVSGFDAAAKTYTR
ncbi:MAG TPA: hypothetical protein VFJ91_13240 [Gaiellaceae bacterium]|nr:hypothetical protein [Gaiellaceae bacterium]